MALPPIIANMGGLHSNTILFYFAESPFFERTSNNAVIMSQAMNNMAMYHYIQTREAFEARLKTMSGLEFIVGEEPAEMAPGTGTGVWVIRKQTRRKRYDEDDEVLVHASYFVVGENIYQAPNFSDILASRLMTISSAIAKALPAAESIRKWRPSLGHVYQLPSNTISTRPKLQDSKEVTPMPDEAGKTAAQKSDELSLERLAEESLMIHMKYGGEYIDENPITGRPGEFHLSSTGRKAVPPPQLSKQDGIGPMTLNTKLDDANKKDEKSPKTPRSAAPKPKRRKSKMSTSTPSAS
ncbi:putative MED6 mediator sub complex component [Thelonectria olida]|uniref:Mediator of RNA polymerase II transcription subunit 6 n=1 Tax=Thelonectria olida TaxID=1576542 RepID=A0A9P8W7A6_9HYPO|nr:putative MED6 mediator sub complex component [Thelonectria olida]